MRQRERACLTLLAAAGIAIGALSADAAGIKWEKSFKSARAASQRSRKPMLVEFYADWCSPCKKMEQTTFKDAEVGKLLRRFVVVRVDIDRERELARTYQVESIPHSIIVSSSGKVVREALGYRDPQAFRLFLKQGLQ
jgi:thioredoxin-like negative regulator of GroEL